MIYVKTGEGGGKTTSAMGLALRALGHGKKVIIIQFMKGRETGEMIALKKFKNCIFKQFGREEFVNLTNPARVDKELARKALEYAFKSLDERPFMLILDEVNLAAATGLVKVKDVLRLIKKANCHIILTGRHSPKSFIRVADFVTNYEDVKRKEVVAREGIEY